MHFLEDFTLVIKYQNIKNHSVKNNFKLTTRKEHSPKKRFKIPPFTRRMTDELVIYIICNKIYNHTSFAQVRELSQSHCGDNREGTLFS